MNWIFFHLECLLIPFRRMDSEKIDFLKKKASAIRKHVVQMVARHGRGYVQQGLGAADLFTVLFFDELRLKIEDPEWPDRDRLILSTAHNSAVYYAVLAEKGLIPLASLESYCVDGSDLEINVSERLGTMVEATCGSLGQGLSVAIGMGISARRIRISSRVYVILGDGELQEGQTWEAIMSAATWKLSNLCLVVDCNGMQVDGDVEKVMMMEPLEEKFEAFGWNVLTAEGNDINHLLSSFKKAKNCDNQPSVILAKTLVGKGVPFLEGQLSHNLIFPADAAKRALEALE